jgi:hypothetical protein
MEGEMEELTLTEMLEASTCTLVWAADNVNGLD